MINNDILKNIEKEKNISFVEQISYNGKTYIKAIKMVQEGIEYIYYELENEKIQQVTNQDTLAYLKENYEINEGGIYY